MKNVIKRGFFFTFLFLAIAALFIYIGLDLPLKESWDAFYQLQFRQISLAIWVLTAILFVSWSIAIWSTTIGRTKERAFQEKIEHIVDFEKTFTESDVLSKRLNKSLHVVSDLLLIQRNRLKKITDEKAQTQDELIQERVIEERQRLARELHDSVSQQLFAASMLISAINESNPSHESQKTLLQIEKIVQQAQLEMRALLLHLRPVALHNKSIVEGLEGLLVELKEKVFFDIRYRLEDVNLTKGAEDHLFRIAQETLSNTLRHAQATEVDILFVERDGFAILRIQDNGVGFKQTDEKNGSYGLQNVQERAIEIGATCKIVSIPSQGTIVEVKLPIESEVKEND